MQSDGESPNEYDEDFPLFALPAQESSPPGRHCQGTGTDHSKSMVMIGYLKSSFQFTCINSHPSATFELFPHCHTDHVLTAKLDHQDRPQITSTEIDKYNVHNVHLVNAVEETWQGYSSPFTLGDLKYDFKGAQRCTLQEIGRDERSALEHLEREFDSDHGQLDSTYTLPVMMEGSSIATCRPLYPRLQHSYHINNVLTYNLLAKTDARNCTCLAILWKIKFEFSGSTNNRPCTQREIARQLCSLKYLILYSQSIACPGYTGLIQVGAKVEIEKDKLNVKEVYVVQTPLKFNTRRSSTSTCQYMHIKSQHHESLPIYYILALKTVTTHETNCSYWQVAI